MHVSYNIGFSDGVKAYRTEFDTDYVAAQLARSHSAPTGTGNDDEFSAYDLLKQIESAKVASCLLPLSELTDRNPFKPMGPLAIHDLQTMAARSVVPNVSILAMKTTHQKPNPRVNVVWAGFFAKIHSIIPLDAGYEINLSEVTKFGLHPVKMDQNEEAAVAKELAEAMAEQKADRARRIADEEAQANRMRIKNSFWKTAARRRLQLQVAEEMGAPGFLKEIILASDTPTE